MNPRSWLAAAAIAPLLLPAAGHADEVGNAIEQAARTYQAGNAAATRTLLREAMQLLTQRTSTRLGAALPPPQSGWQVTDRQPLNGDSASISGGSQFIRRYRSAQNQSVEISVTADSPVLSQLTLVMSNTASADTIGKTIRVGGQSAILTSNNEIHMLVDDRVLIAITGSAPLDAKLAYAEAIDLKLIAGLR